MKQEKTLLQNDISYEGELLKQIGQEAGQSEVPDSLRPEQIEAMLQKRRRKRNRNLRSMFAAAAVLAVVCGTGFGIWHLTGSDDEYSELYTALKEGSELQSSMLYNGSSLRDYTSDHALSKMTGDFQMIQEETASNTVTQSDASADSGYSDTNVQTEGVDEGDIVKTDGQFIYTLDRDYNSLSIVSADQGKIEKRSDIQLPDRMQTQEFYMEGDRLSVLGTIENSSGTTAQTQTITYDITDRSKPKKVGNVTQSGYLADSRMQEGYLYVFSSFSPQIPTNRRSFEDYVPQVNNELLKSSRIYLPEQQTVSQYLVLTAIDLDRPDRTSDRQAALTGSDLFYASRDHLYIASTCWNQSARTELCKYIYQDGKYRFCAKGTVKGYLNDSFSMDEYEGNLLILTTLDTQNGSSYNNVYVLNDKLEEIGSILRLAKGETIYSARFLSDTGYFVTYRETDPLFSVDFSDPRNPKIIGKLKIPGFSDYLQFYGTNQLLGIGMHDGDDARCVKLSMFDLSNPTDVRESDTLVLKDCYDAEALTNHHAVLADEAQNLIGFAASGDESGAYYLYQYTPEHGFQKLHQFDTQSTAYDIRGLYIGQTFYLIQMDQISSYDLKDFQKIDSLKL